MYVQISKGLAALAAVPLLVQSAAASPAMSFVCPDSKDIKSIEWSEGYDEVFVMMRSGEVALQVTGPLAEDGSFGFAGNGWRFWGLMPEGGLMKGDGPVTQCYQSEASQRSLATYPEPENIWPKHKAKGLASGNIRDKPSQKGKKVASLEMNSKITILQNADKFQDGFFWYKIEYAPKKTGYIWGALLCTNEEAQDLSATLRRCP